MNMPGDPCPGHAGHLKTENIMVSKREDALVAEVEREPLISWGAVFAGMVFVIAASWLMVLLGSAIGVSIADFGNITSNEDFAEGLGIGAILWLMFSALVVFFLSGLLAGRLSGKPDPTVGMLHGLTLWSLGTALMLLFGAWGVGGLIQTGQSVVTSTVQTGMALGNAGIEGTSAVVRNLSDSPVLMDIQAMLKRKAIEAVAESQTKSGATASKKELKRAVKEVDPRTLKKVAAYLIQGDEEKAKKRLARSTNLSEEEVESIVSGISEQVEDLEETELVQELQADLKNKMGKAVQQVSQISGPEVSTSELKLALKEMDAETLGLVAKELALGNPERAKNVLAVRTSLDEKEVEAIVDGVTREVDQKVAEAKKEIDEAVEVASEYTQAVLWVSFTSAALGLVVAIIGGWVGSSTVRRLYAVEVTRQVTA